MSLFNKKNTPLGGEGIERQKETIPITDLDLTIRYDIYCSDGYNDRLYSNVSINGYKTLSRNSDYPSAFEEFLELETKTGTRMLIRTMAIDTMCEAGVEPIYRLVPRRKRPRPN